MDRRPLWDSLLSIAGVHDLPWMVVGDFNAILDVSDRVGGRLPQAADTLDFAACLNAAGLSDLAGSKHKNVWSDR